MHDQFQNKRSFKSLESIAKSINQEWTKDISKEVPIILTEIDVHGSDMADYKITHPALHP